MREPNIHDIRKIYPSLEHLFEIPQLKITKEMIDFSNKRLDKHIRTVQHFATKIENYFPKFKGLKNVAAVHDKSKKEDPEKDPYVLLSWKHHRPEHKFNLTQIKAMQDTTFHHIRNNPHHPEYFVKRKFLSLRGENEKNLDVSKMRFVNLGEMLADWTSMSAELSTDSRDWADKVIGSKYDFTNQQVSTIYEVLNKFQN